MSASFEPRLPILNFAGLSLWTRLSGSSAVPNKVMNWSALRCTRRTKLPPNKPDSFHARRTQTDLGARAPGPLDFAQFVLIVSSLRWPSRGREQAASLAASSLMASNKTVTSRVTASESTRAVPAATSDRFHHESITISDGKRRIISVPGYFRALGNPCRLGAFEPIFRLSDFARSFAWQIASDPDKLQRLTRFALPRGV